VPNQHPEALPRDEHLGEHAATEVIADGEANPLVRQADAPGYAVSVDGQSMGQDYAPREKVGPKYIWLMVLATFGVMVALVTPIAISLAIRVQELVPGQEEVLGYVLGAGAAATVFVAPLVGMLSDRTRTRIGRRRPYMIAGGILGMIALFIIAGAPSVLILGLGWVMAQIGWGAIAQNALIYTQADRLPEEQRGKVAGMVGFATMLAPIMGAGIASSLVGSNYMMFLVPGGVGLLFLTLFVIFMGGDDSREMPIIKPLNPSQVLRNFVFDPRQYPDFAWNWLARVFFNIGVALATTFTTFFFAARLGATVAEIAGFVVILSLGGVLAAALGALGGGWVSDKIKKRRLLVLVSGALFTTGALVMSFAPELPMIFAGAMITNIGLGMFAAIDQALALDVLPERDTDAGRFLGILGYSTSLPQAIGPLIAPAILLIGVAGKNYTLLFMVAAACTLIGGMIVMLKVKGAR
jgi:MFS family permease